jgi:hypothetical protein
MTAAPKSPTDSSWTALNWYLQRTEEDKPESGPILTAVKDVAEAQQSHEDLVELFTLFLATRGCSLYGRAFDIHSTSGRAECAEFLANAVEGAAAL